MRTSLYWSTSVLVAASLAGVAHAEESYSASTSAAAPVAEEPSACPPPQAAKVSVSAQDDPCVKHAPRLTPPGAQVVAGGHEDNRPLLRVDLDDPCMRLTFPVSMAVRGTGVSDVPVDRDGNIQEHGFSLHPRLRVGAIFDSGRYWNDISVRVEYEHDLVNGAISDIPSLGGQGYPDRDGIDHQLRKAYVRVASLGSTYAHMAVGYQTSHWGLGLVANDGAHSWQPGSARFSDPRGGDRVLRAQIALGSVPAGVVAFINADLLDNDFLADDDILLENDRGTQMSAAVVVGPQQPHNVGVYLAYRDQQDQEGVDLKALVIDVAGETAWDVNGVILKAKAELAMITGTTQLGASTTFPEQSVSQAAFALRASADYEAFGGALDFLYASGDQNSDDDSQNAFRTDPNYEMGLLLFRQLLSAQTARGAFTAGDPGLVGVPSIGVERIPTRQSHTNTVALFPRFRVRPLDGLEAYGGPMFAFAAVPMVDPFNTRIAGGQQRNALDGVAGSYLGTELDLGVRYRLNVADMQLTAGVEGGALFPGDAFDNALGESMDTVMGGRFMVEAAL